MLKGESFSIHGCQFEGIVECVWKIKERMACSLTEKIEKLIIIQTCKLNPRSMFSGFTRCDPTNNVRT